MGAGSACLSRSGKRGGWCLRDQRRRGASGARSDGAVPMELASDGKEVCWFEWGFVGTPVGEAVVTLEGGLLNNVVERLTARKRGRMRKEEKGRKCMVVG